LRSLRAWSCAPQSGRSMRCGPGFTDTRSARRQHRKHHKKTVPQPEQAWRTRQTYLAGATGFHHRPKSTITVIVAVRRGRRRVSRGQAIRWWRRKGLGARVMLQLSHRHSDGPKDHTRNLEIPGLVYRTIPQDGEIEGRNPMTKTSNSVTLLCQDFSCRIISCSMWMAAWPR